MKVKISPWLFAMVCAVLLLAKGLVAQTTTQLFGPFIVGPSIGGASYATPYAFNSSTLNLTCPASGILATLSGPAASGGNLLVDNNIIVTVTPAGNGLATPSNVCPASGVTITGQGLYNENCFSTTYENAAGGLTGQNPDTYLLTNNGGVPPIDISPYLSNSGSPQSVTIALTDEGGIAASSSLFLTTNCTIGPVSGGTISGNPITGSSDGATQTFTFNSNTLGQQLVQFGYDVSQVTSFDSNEDGSTPIAGDMPIDPGTFQSNYVPLTSFATSNCIVHNGEALPAGGAACKVYTLECSNPNASTPVSGANCPVSAELNEVVQDNFDGPSFSLPSITTPYGTFHEGMGFLMASDDWTKTGGACTFDPNAGPVADLPCPQNLLINFSGPGTFSGSGLTTNPNSTFISVYGVPEDLTTVNLQGAKRGNWVNTSTPSIGFITVAPNLSNGAYVQGLPLAGASSYIPAPIASITYGISGLNNVPVPLNEPISGDTTLRSGVCSSGPFTAPTVPNFAPPTQTLAPLTDGQYLLHYYAQDCAGTQELLFTQDPSQSWSTNFYTIPVNVDVTAPVAKITSPTPSQSFKKGVKVYGSFYCTDATTGSGVTHCGSNSFSTGTTYDTRLVGPLQIKLNTSSVGTQTLSIDAVDGAGNRSTTSVSYTVTNK